MEKPISSEEIYQDILNKIIDLELEPGSKISENRIADEYGVSRSVIRNAFARLTQDMFLTVYPQRGTYVNYIDLDYIRTALLIRIAIEKEMLYRFMKKKDKSNIIEKMKVNIKKQEDFYYANEYMEEFQGLDEEFHEYIIISVENENILNLISIHLLHISRWRNVYIRLGYKVSHLIDEHRLILKYIEEDDLDMALQCMTKHIETVTGEIHIDPEYKHYFMSSESGKR